MRTPGATLEPGTAHPLQRLRAVRELVDAGVNAGVLMAPIVPGFSSSRTKVERTIKAIADHGARFVGCNVMYLQDGTRTHFMKFIEREFPAMAPRFERLYTREVSARGLSQRGQGDGAGSAATLWAHKARGGRSGPDREAERPSIRSRSDSRGDGKAALRGPPCQQRYATSP